MPKLIVDSNDFARMLKRISHEILEKNSGPNKLILIGMHTRGVPLAKRISEFIENIEGIQIPTAHHSKIPEITPHKNIYIYINE